MSSHARPLAAALLAVLALGCIRTDARPVSGSKPSPLANFGSKAEAVAALAAYEQPLQGDLVTAAADTTLNMTLAEAQVQQLWKDWKIKYRKTYSSTSEDLRRYAIFKANLQLIIASNRNPTITHISILNEFVDLTFAEFQARLTRPYTVADIKPADTEPAKAPSVRAVRAPPVVDWRTQDKLAPPKDQGNCGNCWAYATVAALEAKVLIARGQRYSTTRINLSEQQVTDCVSVAGGYESMGCDGGYIDEPFVYAAKQYVTTEARYPSVSQTTGRNQACSSSRLAGVPGSDKIQLSGAGAVQLQQWSAAALREAVAVQPVVIVIKSAVNGFQFLGGEVWQTSRCTYPGGAPNTRSASVDHAMLVVGYNMTAKVPYWIIANSWGTNWGVGGYGKVEMAPDNSWGTCFMYTWMVHPTNVIPTSVNPPIDPRNPTVRLVDSAGRTGAGVRAGRLEVKRNNVWGTVCDDNFGNVAATVVCRQLNLTGSGIAYPEAAFGMGTGNIWLDEVGCTGTENSIEQCFNPGWGVHDCSHSEDVGVSCVAPPQPPAVTVRLVNGPNNRTGRLEVYRNGTWGTVCDDNFDAVDAGVVCRQLKLGMTGTVVPSSTVFGTPATGKIWLDEVACKGTETALEQCSNAGWGTHDCLHNEDVGVSCAGSPTPPTATVRLVNGTSSGQGRLEVLYNNQWGTVCDDGFTDVEASIVCKQLGFAASGTAIPMAGFGEGAPAAKIWLDEVTCVGTEATLQACYNDGWGVTDCTHEEDVGVICMGAGPTVTVRLANGNRTHGRVEVWHDGEWGTVCDDNFSAADAQVVCRQLGMRGGTVFPEARYGQGTGTVWMDEVACSGTEARLELCRHNGWENTDCLHNEDVAVGCS